MIYFEIYTDLNKEIDLSAKPVFDDFVTEKEVSNFIRLILERELAFEVFTNETLDDYKLMQIRMKNIFLKESYHELSHLADELKGGVLH